jgi:hypothetical protein
LFLPGARTRRRVLGKTEARFVVPLHTPVLAERRAAGCNSGGRFQWTKFKKLPSSSTISVDKAVENECNPPVTHGRASLPANQPNICRRREQLPHF